MSGAESEEERREKVRQSSLNERNKSDVMDGSDDYNRVSMEQ